MPCEVPCVVQASVTVGGEVTCPAALVSPRIVITTTNCFPSLGQVRGSDYSSGRSGSGSGYTATVVEHPALMVHSFHDLYLLYYLYRSCAAGLGSCRWWARTTRTAGSWTLATTGRRAGPWRSCSSIRLVTPN